MILSISIFYSISTANKMIFIHVCTFILNVHFLKQLHQFALPSAGLVPRAVLYSLGYFSGYTDSSQWDTSPTNSLLTDSLPTTQFAARTIHRPDILPKRLYAYWTVRRQGSSSMRRRFLHSQSKVEENFANTITRESSIKF